MDFISLLGLIITLAIDTAFSWVRMFAALAVSIVISIFVGIYAATHKYAEKIILPIVDILQTLPILAFFPFVIFIIVAAIPGSIGINLAVVFLIITSMIWNIIFGVYESIKVLPKEYGEISKLYGLSRIERFRKIYLPAVMPRVVEQSTLSWSIGLFYLVTSEIFSTGNSQYAVKTGIGAAIASPLITGSALAYGLALLVFIVFVIATRLLFFKPLEEYVVRYNRHTQQKPESRAISYAKVMGSFGSRIARRLNPQQLIRSSGSAKTAMKKRGARSVREEGGIATIEKYGTAIKYAAVALIILGIAYVFITNPALMGYEATVLRALVYTFARVWFAFAIALLIGVPVSVYLIFLTRHSSKYLLLFQILSSIPATILLPAIVAGLKGTPYHGEITAVIIFVLGGVWYIIFSTMNMAKTLSPSIPEVKGIYGVKGADAWKKIYIRAIIPGLITGGITAIAAEWNASIVAEYFTVGNNVAAQVGIGVGKLLDLSLSANNLTLMLLAVANITVMIILLNTFVWKKLYRSVSKMYG